MRIQQLEVGQLVIIFISIYFLHLIKHSQLNPSNYSLRLKALIKFISIKAYLSWPQIKFALSIDRQAARIIGLEVCRTIRLYFRGDFRFKSPPNKLKFQRRLWSPPFSERERH